MPIYDEDIARIKAHVLLTEADKITAMAENRGCSCNPGGQHSLDCPKEVLLRVARMLRMDAEA